MLTYETISQYYEQVQQQQKQARQNRLDEVYAKIPAVRQIDEEIKNTGYSAISSVLHQEADIEQARKKIHLLYHQRAQLLAGQGYPENYTDMQYLCERCKDTGFIKTEPCSCRAAIKSKLLLEKSNLPENLHFESFDKFRYDLYDTQKNSGNSISPKENIEAVIKSLKRFVSSFPNGENILLFGKTGLGKTYLSGCIAKEITLKGFEVFYQSAFKIFSVLEELKFKGDQTGTNQQIADKIYNVPLLIIDDLGSEFISSYSAAVLFDIINTRILNSKSTIINTNLSMDELNRTYSSRIVSRLFGEYTVMRIIGSDIRTKKLLHGGNQ